MTATKANSRFFYDSYAVVEYLNGNKNYKPYFEGPDGVLTKLNLMEIYFKALTGVGAKAATQVLDSFAQYLIDFDVDDIKGAMDLRLKLKNKGLDISYADALGYYLARRLGMVFLTGDDEFKELGYVEFVK